MKQDIAHKILQDQLMDCFKELSRGHYSFILMKVSTSNDEFSCSVLVQALSGQFGTSAKIEEEVSNKLQERIPYIENLRVKYFIDEDRDGADRWVNIDFTPNQQMLRSVRSEHIIAEKSLEILSMIECSYMNKIKSLKKKHEKILNRIEGFNYEKEKSTPPKPPECRTILEGKDPVKPKSMT